MRISRTTLTVIGVIAVVAIIAVVAGGGSGDPDTATNVTREFETAALRDLAEVTTLDGTLGFPEGDDVASRLQGTITSVAGSGTIVTEGTTLYEVDGEPVILLLGTLPAYRDLGQEPVVRTIVAGGNGTVTALPEPGATVESGGELFRIADTPVIALAGDLPAWRSLRRNDEGMDVLQLEQALVALGYDPNGTVTVDGIYSTATATMVAAWQEASGLAETGRFSPTQAVFLPGPAVVTGVAASVGSSLNASAAVLTVQVASEPIAGPDVLQLQEALTRLGYDAPTTGVFDDATRVAVERWQGDTGAEVDGIVHLGEIVFLPSPVRVTEALLTIGRPVNNGSSVLATTGSSSVVLVDLPAEDQQLLAVGQIVTVALPDGSQVDGVVTVISGIATRRSSGDVVFETTIELDSASVAADLDQAPVDVLVVTDQRTAVLAVPVTALLALAEGGYAVEVDAGGGTTRLVAVTPGLYADGWVEVTAAGLTAGDRVVVP